MNASRPKDFNAAVAGNDNDDWGVVVKVKRSDGFEGHQTARFHISVGNDNHEHPKFRATMNWALQNFDKIIICVNDTLQRHNFLFEGETPKSAYAHARQAGDDWIKRNIRGGMHTSPRIEVKRWSEWITREEFAVKRDEVMQVLREDYQKNKLVEEEIQAFWKRVQRRDSAAGEFDFAKFQVHSRDYLLEECAAFAIMFEEELAADVYPGGSLLPCRLFKPDEQKHSEHGFTRLEFRQTLLEGTQRSDMRRIGENRKSTQPSGTNYDRLVS